MKKIKIFFPIAVFAILIMAFSFNVSSAGITQSSPSPSDDATGVYVRTTLSIVLNEADGETINGTILFVSTGDTYTISTASNGSQTLTLPSGSLPLEALTSYQWWVNVSNETGVWVNTSYNFTTGTPSRISDSTTFNANELLVIGLILVAVVFGVLVFILDMMKEKKLDIKKLMGLVIIIVLMTVVLGFI